MNCPRCRQPVEPTAAFCGNCGHALLAGSPTGKTHVSVRNALGAAALPMAGAAAPVVPAYAIADPRSHKADTKALLALIFGIIGVLGSLFMAILGLAFGIAGIVMGTTARANGKRASSTVGIVLSSIAVLASLAVWTYAIKNDTSLHSQATKSSSSSSSHALAAPSTADTSLDTPCYNTGFSDTLNISNASDSCDMGAFDGPTMDSSTNLYKVYANTADVETEAGFQALAKQALENDVKANLDGFTIDSEVVGQFAGSPAYFIQTSNASKNVALVEAAVYHDSPNGKNVFVLVHATTGKKTDLNTMEAQWQWK